MHVTFVVLFVCDNVVCVPSQFMPLGVRGLMFGPVVQYCLVYCGGLKFCLEMGRDSNLLTIPSTMLTPVLMFNKSPKVAVTHKEPSYLLHLIRRISNGISQTLFRHRYL